MSVEPVSGAATAVASWKLIGWLAGLGAFGAGMAGLVVMCMTRPKTDQEWIVALVSTFMSSIGGCAGFVAYFKLQYLVNDIFGLLALGGLFFAFALPGWAIVRWLFNGIAKRDAQKADLFDVVKDVKESI